MAQSFISISGPFGHKALLKTIPVSFPSGVTVLHVTGVTRDSSSAPLAGVTVSMFLTSTNAPMGQTISDGSGNYSFTLYSPPGPFYIIAYLAGSPDVAGTTVNTLVAS